jgi:pilus assembly protein CpaE
VDVSGGQNIAAALESLSKFRALAPGMPVALWSDSEDPGLAATASQAGVSGCMTGGGNPQELTSIFTGVLDKWAASKVTELFGAPDNATIISCMGVKGGVGTTTIAMNVATALTGRGSVILAEVRPMFGSLQSYFRPGRMVRGFSNRLDFEVTETGARMAALMLWPVPGVEGLRLLFGPQTPEDCGEIEPERATKLLQTLAARADFVVVDLPASLSQANRAILGASHYFTIIVEPVPACMRLGRLALDAIQNWERAPAFIATVVVKHSSDVAPIPLPEIEGELGVPIHSVVPPASELCAQAERARLPMIQCDPDSLAADSFLTLARRFLLQSRLAASAAESAASGTARHDGSRYARSS